MSDVHLGVDIGGTGMKAAPVDLSTGRLTAERLRIETPHPATPKAMAAVADQLIEHFAWTGPVGMAFPAVIKHGVTMTAANVDPSWVGQDAAALFGEATGCTVTMTNDADAAGVAEVKFGAGKGVDGVVVLVTLGTGIGSALFVDGLLVPNTELGHLVIRGKDAERRAAESVRDSKGLSWKAWAKRLNEYLQYVERLLAPDLVIVGGGASKKADKFIPLLELDAPVVPAALENEAGIVGAALSVSLGRPARATTRATGRRRPGTPAASKATASVKSPLKRAARRSRNESGS